VSLVDIRVLEEVTDAWKDCVFQELRNFNLERNRTFWELRERAEHKARPLFVMAIDAERAVIGGLIGSSEFHWMKIDIMAVRAPFRRRGIGRLLVAAAEKEALARNCKYVFVDTMSYQAPEFYEKLGYQVAGSLQDWDSHGHTKFFMTKTLCG
jgi:GNAT superfamily N-acetyltransferase